MRTTEAQRGALVALKRLPLQERQQGTEREATRKLKDQLSEVDYVTLGYVRMYAEGIHGYQLALILSRSPICASFVRLPQVYRVLHRLEHEGLVMCRVEAGGRRLKYLFTITPLGESRFRKWLTRSHRESCLNSDQLLNRLRFAGQLSADALLSLVEGVAHDCQEDLENLRKEAGGMFIMRASRLEEARLVVIDVHRITGAHIARIGHIFN